MNPRELSDMSRPELLQLVHRQQEEIVTARTVNIHLKARVAIAVKLLQEAGIEEPNVRRDGVRP